MMKIYLSDDFMKTYFQLGMCLNEIDGTFRAPESQFGTHNVFIDPDSTLQQITEL